MNTEIKRLLEGVRDGTVNVEEALLRLKSAPFEDIGYAKIDFHREVRQGATEVIYGAGKTVPQIIGIIGSMKQNGRDRILITRLSADFADEIAKKYQKK